MSEEFFILHSPNFIQNLRNSYIKFTKQKKKQIKKIRHCYGDNQAVLYIKQTYYQNIYNPISTHLLSLQGAKRHPR